MNAGNHAGNQVGNQVIIFRKRIAGLSPSALERFVMRARKAIHLRDLVNVLVTNSRELRSLNRQFRGTDNPTDVLSFPSPPVARSPAMAREETRLRRSLKLEIGLIERIPQAARAALSGKKRRDGPAGAKRKTA